MPNKTDPEKEKKQRREFLKQAADTLQETKKQLLKEMQGRVKEETEGVKDEGRDTYDLASDERDREINFILNDREREKLLAIDEALQRIKDKTYGICESCEGEIQLGRLKVLPFTRLCVKCQEETEREQTSKRPSKTSAAIASLSLLTSKKTAFNRSLVGGRFSFQPVLEFRSINPRQTPAVLSSDRLISKPMGV